MIFVRHTEMQVYAHGETITAQAFPVARCANVLQRRNGGAALFTQCCWTEFLNC